MYVVTRLREQNNNYYTRLELPGEFLQLSHVSSNHFKLSLLHFQINNFGKIIHGYQEPENTIF